MKLIGFRIQNIKSIKDSGLCHLSNTDNITIFAGQNEAGKSAILEGLDFFRNGLNEKFSKLSMRSDSTYPFVECKFELDSSDLKSDVDVSVVLNKVSTVSFTRGKTDSPDFHNIEISDETKALIDSFIPETELAPKVEAVPQESLEGELQDLTTESEVTTKENIKDKILKHLLVRLPEFIYYDSFNSYLPGEIKLDEIDSSQAVKDFEKVFGINFKDLVGLTPQARQSCILKINNNATADLNEYWKQKLSDIEADTNDKYQYSISFHPNIEPNSSIIDFMIHRNDETPLYIEQKSKGFQWFSAFHLRLKSIGVENTANKYIVLIDEPGQGLHEKAQSNVKAVLEELQLKGMQVLYTTHNPSLIGISDSEILRIRIVYQNRSEGTKIKNITQYSTISGSKDALSPIITAMGINSIGQILDRAIPCIVLEGITDHYYFTAMKKYLDIQEAYYFIPSVGVPNILPLISILIGWGADFKAIFDDGGAGNKVYKEIRKNLYPGTDNEETLNAKILKMDKFSGIEDLFSSADFDNYITGESRVQDEKNSELAKRKKKELLARLFLEKISKNSPSITLSNETTSNFKKVFDWLKAN